MNQAVDCELFRYVFDSCSVYQHKSVKEIEKSLNKKYQRT